MPISKEEFEKWLHCDDYKPLTYQDRGTFITHLKVPRDEHFDYLYWQKNYRGTALERNNGFEYTGIYNKNDGLIYDAHNRFQKISPQIEFSKSISVMESELNEAVRTIIDSNINNDRNNLTVVRITDFEKEADLIHFKQHLAPKAARKLFLDGTSPEDIVFHCDYEYKGWTEDDLLDFIRSGEQFEISEATEYIASHQEEMLMQFLEHDLIKKKLQAIEDDPQNRLHRIKAIIDAVKSVPEAKTVTVRIDTPEATMSFKTSAAELRCDQTSTYSTYNIDASDRREFELLFGRGFSYSPDDIMRIDYGKKVLYEAEPGYLQAHHKVTSISEVDESPAVSDDETEDEDVGMTM